MKTKVDDEVYARVYAHNVVSTFGRTGVRIRSSDRGYFRKYLLFSSRSIFFCSFPGDFMCSPNRYLFAKNASKATKQITIFQEGLLNINEQIPGRYHPPNDISAICLCRYFQRIKRKFAVYGRQTIISY